MREATLPRTSPWKRWRALYYNAEISPIGWYRHSRNGWQAFASGVLSDGHSSMQEAFSAILARMGEG